MNFTLVATICSATVRSIFDQHEFHEVRNVDFDTVPTHEGQVNIIRIYCIFVIRFRGNLRASQYVSQLAFVSLRVAELTQFCQRSDVSLTEIWHDIYTHQEILNIGAAVFKA